MAELSQGSVRTVFTLPDMSEVENERHTQL